MSSDRCNREEILQPCDGNENQKMLVGNSTLLSNSSSSGPNKMRQNSDRPRNQNDTPEKCGADVFLKNELICSAEFNKTIAAWFGEKGFTAMRSFFRASVLNSLQKDPIGLNQTNCSDLDVMIVTLIADYLVKNGKYFTMSVFSNEVLRPWASFNPILKELLQRIGKCEGPGEPALSLDSVSLVLRTLDIQVHSMLGAEILQKYLEDRTGDLLNVLMSLLRDNAPILNVKERAVRDDDVVAAFSEGLQEEMGKLHCWFSNFNSQFVDVSGKLKKLISSQITDGVRSKNHPSGTGILIQQFSVDEQDLWTQMVRMEEHLKKQQESLMKMRDTERKKLATYAKELEDLHQEMNMKLKSIQDYEKTLRMREKALREFETVENCGRGDLVVDVAPKNGFWTESNTRKGRHDPKQFSRTMTDQIMEENLELKAILREQNLRIDSLTKKVALLTCAAGCYCEPMTSPLPNRSHGDTMPYSNQPYGNVEISRVPARLGVLPLKSSRFPTPSFPRDSLVSVMSSTLRRAKMDIDSLRDEQNTVDLQCDRLLHNKLSKRL